MDCKGFDEQVVRLDKQISDLADQFVLARIVNMRGVDLRRFDFDFDLTWAGLFLNKEGQVFGRFGGRDGDSPDKYLTLDGLKHAMSEALIVDRRGEFDEPAPAPTDTFRSADQYPSAKRLKPGACIHCHQVYNFRQDWHRSQGTWTRDRIWVNPPPENLGFSLDPAEQNRVKSIKHESPAAKAGMKEGDLMLFINRQRVASFADAQYALQRAPASGRLVIRWQRREEKHENDLELPANWRETDIAWRESMWNLEPAASIWGIDLSAAEKKQLGLGAKQLAFRQAAFVPTAAREAGIREGDIILGVDGKELDLTMRQFNAYVRLNYQAGDMVNVNLIRAGKKMNIPMKLPKKD